MTITINKNQNEQIIFGNVDFSVPGGQTLLTDPDPLNTTGAVYRIWEATISGSNVNRAAGRALAHWEIRKPTGGGTAFFAMDFLLPLAPIPGSIPTYGINFRPHGLVVGGRIRFFASVAFTDAAGFGMCNVTYSIENLA
jgi:hypothetical protein